MKSTDAHPLYETKEIGTPLDYTDDLYRVYFELMDVDGKAGEIITGFLGAEQIDSIMKLDYGYEVELPIQSVPDIVRELSRHNIAIYQVVRYAKVKSLKVLESR